MEKGLLAMSASKRERSALLGVHPDSLNEWQRVHPEFSVAVQAGRATATAFWGAGYWMWLGAAPATRKPFSGLCGTAHVQPQAGTTRTRS